MLGKLLKYDLKYMIRNMGVFYILTIMSALLTRLFLSINQTTIFIIISKISEGLLYAMIGNIIFNTIIRSVVIFKKYLYKDEAYLTHALPVTKTQIYESKFLQTVIFTLVGFLVIVASLFIAFYTKDRFVLIQSVINGISDNFDINVWSLIFIIIAALFVEIINIIQCCYISIIIGYRRNDSKSVVSFIYMTVFYFLSQAFVLLTAFLVALFNKDVMIIFTSNEMPSRKILKLLFLVTILAYVVVIFIMNLLCNKELEKGVNLE